MLAACVILTIIDTVTIGTLIGATIYLNRRSNRATAAAGLASRRREHVERKLSADWNR